MPKPKLYIDSKSNYSQHPVDHDQVFSLFLLTLTAGSPTVTRLEFDDAKDGCCSDGENSGAGNICGNNDVLLRFDATGAMGRGNGVVIPPDSSRKARCETVVGRFGPKN